MIKVQPIPPEAQTQRLTASLEYQRKHFRPETPGMTAQLVIGAAIWFVGIGIAVGMMALSKSTAFRLQYFYFAAFVVPTAVEIALAIYFSERKEWSYVIAGQLIGLGVTLLVPIWAMGFALFGRI